MKTTLTWSPPSPPTEDTPYDHVTAATPFGSILITWKGWKEHDCPEALAPWSNGVFTAYPTLDEAKAGCEAEYSALLLRAEIEQNTGKALVFTYTNHRGETSLRCVTPKRVEFTVLFPWYPRAVWLLTGHDHEKGEDRSFRLDQIEGKREWVDLARTAILATRQPTPGEIERLAVSICEAADADPKPVFVSGPAPVPPIRSRVAADHARMIHKSIAPVLEMADAWIAIPDLPPDDRLLAQTVRDMLGWIKLVTTPTDSKT